MPKNYWMIVISPENFQIARDRSFDIVGLKAIHKRKVLRIQPGDRIVLYIWGIRCFAATVTVTSPLVEEDEPVWQQEGSSTLPFRIGITPNIVLKEEQFIHANFIAPRMDFVRRWTPELWHLAFQGNLNLVSKYDFALIETEMIRIRRNKILDQTSRMPRPNKDNSNCQLDSGVGTNDRRPVSLSSYPLIK